MVKERRPVASVELSPSKQVVDTLRGKISDPLETISYRPGPEFGQRVSVRLAMEGSGMFGLTHMRDSREWSGITNHVLLTARYTVHLARELMKTHPRLDIQAILDGMIVSHAGRRQWDEAGWYKDGVAELVGNEEQVRRRSISNETLGMQLVQGKVPDEAFRLVVALGHNVEGYAVDPAVYKSLEFLLSIYVDHRTSQSYEPLNKRMGDFLIGNFISKEKMHPWTKDVIYDMFGRLIQRQKDFRLGKTEMQEVTLPEADELAVILGAGSHSERLSRRELMRLIIQDSDTEALLEGENVDTELDEVKVPMPKWENEFRLAYVEAAKEEIVERMKRLLDGKNHDEQTFEKEFPKTTWWGRYARIVAGLYPDL